MLDTTYPSLLECALTCHNLPFVYILIHFLMDRYTQVYPLSIHNNDNQSKLLEHVITQILTISLIAAPNRYVLQEYHNVVINLVMQYWYLLPSVLTISHRYDQVKKHKHVENTLNSHIVYLEDYYQTTKLNDFFKTHNPSTHTTQNIHQDDTGYNSNDPQCNAPISTNEQILNKLLLPIQQHIFTATQISPHNEFTNNKNDRQHLLASHLRSE
eukprot:UN02821